MEAIQETPGTEENIDLPDVKHQTSRGSEGLVKSERNSKAVVVSASNTYSVEYTADARSLSGYHSKPTSSSSAVTKRHRNTIFSKTKRESKSANGHHAEEYYSAVHRSMKIEGKRPLDEHKAPKEKERSHSLAGSLAASVIESKPRGTKITVRRLSRNTVPPLRVRLTAVSMSPSDKDIHRESSFYVEEPKSRDKVMRWDVANNARPPLQIDMDGPTPWTYTPRNKPLNETNSPSWSFGSKCFTEKPGGSRTSWEKTWFQDKDIWRNKVDFFSDRVWPTPVQYEKKQLLGPNQSTTVEAPSFSIGQRRTLVLNKPGSDKEPAPNDYNRHSADFITLKKDPSFSLQFRRGGTCLWSYRENTPGPAAYSPRFFKNKPLGPSFKIVGVRREKSHVLGPFATF